MNKVVCALPVVMMSVCPLLGLAQERQDAVPVSEASPSSGLADEQNNASALSESSAREERAEAAPPKRKARIVEEIVVTAQKREENLMDVPISVSSFSADALEARGTFDAVALTQSVPGFTAGQTSGFTSLFIRGIGSDAFLWADPSVALYTDGVYFPFQYGMNQEFGGVERVEVLKGPQGTLFGRNALGGAVNVISKSPHETPEFEGLVSYVPRYDQTDYRAFLNLPLADTLYMSIAGFYGWRSSVYDDSSFLNIDGRHRPIPDAYKSGFRIRLKYQPTDRFYITLTASDFNASNPDGKTGQTTYLSLLGQLLGNQLQPNYHAEITNAGIVLRNFVQYLNAELQLDPFDIKLLASYQDAKARGSHEYDGGTAPVVQFYDAPQRAQAQSYELQFISNATSWGSDWLQWQGGVYAYKDERGEDPVLLEVAGLELTGNYGQGGLALYALEPLAELLDPTLNFIASFVPITAPIGGSGDLLGTASLPSGQLRLGGVIGTESLAYYLQTTATITEWMDVTLGARYQSEDKYIIESSAALASIVDPGHQQFVTIQEYSGQTETTNSFSPKISFQFRPYEGGLFYASYQEATKSGTFNVINVYNPPEYIKPEKMKAYEIGFKTPLFGDLIQLSAAAFDYKIKNNQVQFIALTNGGAISMENAGGSRTKGAEIDTTISLFPNLIDNLSLLANATYIDHEYTTYKNASGFAKSTGLFVKGFDFSGKPVVRTPDFSANVLLSKTWFLNNSSVEASTTYYYNSGYSFFAQGLPHHKQPAYSTLSAQLSYRYDPWQTRVTVFGSNLLDEYYTNGQFTTDFGTIVYVADRQTIGVRLGVEF